jgi:two-component system, chemotaxis family, sensor kinase CheA
MELTRYLDLYVAETREHLRALHRGLLELESGGGGRALEEAFRAAHTVKGMSAAMGFRRVTELAHRLEDLLEEVRSGRRTIDAGLVDELLAGADLLERSVEEASAGSATADEAPAGAAPPVPAAATAGGRAPVPEGATFVQVELSSDAVLKAARALVALRRVEALGEVLGTDPPHFDDDFGGVFRIFLPAGAERAPVEAALRAAGEVARVSWESDAHAPPKGDAAAEAVQASAGLRGRHVRVEQLRVDELANGIGELGILQGRLEQIVPARDEALVDVADRIRRLVKDLQETVLAIRMVPVGEVFERLPRVVRDSARALGKDIDFVIEGRDIKIDRAILEELVDPLVHLLRNAVDHGIEPPAERRAAGKPERGRLRLSAVRERSSILIRVEDDGRGVPRRKVAERAIAEGIWSGDVSALTGDELLRLVSQSGISTAERVTSISGRGVGLDVVMARTRGLGGAAELQTVEGQGTTFVLRLPITLAVAQALRVRIGDEFYAIPLTHVSEAVELGSLNVERSRGAEVVRIRSDAIPLIRLRHVLRVPVAGQETAAVVAGAGDRRAALAVDELIGREQIVVRDFDPGLGALPLFSGVTLLADGRPALVLDPVSVL